MNINIEKPVMLGIIETAEAWGITQHYVRQLALSGKVKAVRIGRGKILINQQSVADYFNNSYLTAENSETNNGGIMPISVKG